MAYDKSARTSNNDIVTWVYGGDGFAASTSKRFPLHSTTSRGPRTESSRRPHNVYACKRALDDDVKGGIFVPKDALHGCRSGEAGGGGAHRRAGNPLRSSRARSRGPGS